MSRPEVLLTVARGVELQQLDANVRLVSAQDPRTNPTMSLGSLVHLSFWVLAHKRTEAEVPHLFLNVPIAKDAILDAGADEMGAIAQRKAAMEQALGVTLAEPRLPPNHSATIQRGSLVVARDANDAMQYHYRADGNEEAPPLVTWPLFAEMSALVLAAWAPKVSPALHVPWLPTRKPADWVRFGVDKGVNAAAVPTPLITEIEWSPLDALPDRYDILLGLIDEVIPTLTICAELSGSTTRPLLQGHSDHLKRLKELLEQNGAKALRPVPVGLAGIVHVLEEGQALLQRALSLRATMAARFEQLANRREQELLGVKAEADRAAAAAEAARAALSGDRDAIGRDRQTLEDERRAFAEQQRAAEEELALAREALDRERRQLGEFENELIQRSDRVQNAERVVVRLEGLVGQLREMAGETVDRLVSFLGTNPDVARILLRLSKTDGGSDQDVAAELLD